MIERHQDPERKPIPDPDRERPVERTDDVEVEGTRGSGDDYYPRDGNDYDD